MHQLFSRSARTAIMESSSSGKSEKKREADSYNEASHDGEDDDKMEVKVLAS